MSNPGPIVRSGLAIFVACASLAMLITPTGSALADPKASPVTVVNPATGPALVSRVDDPGRSAYQAVPETTDCPSGKTCIFHFPAIPGGYRLVIQHVSGSLALSGTPSDGVGIDYSAPLALDPQELPFSSRHLLLPGVGSINRFYSTSRAEMRPPS